MRKPKINIGKLFSFTAPIILMAIIGIIIIWPRPAMATDLTKVITENTQLKTVWQMMLGLVDVLVVIGLILISFSNILRIQIDTYSIKKALPAMVIGVILANLSYLICTEIIGLVDVLTNFFLSGKFLGTSGRSAADNVQNISAAFGGFGGEAGQDIGRSLGAIVGGLLMIAAALMVFALAFLMYIRNYVIYFTIVLSPLAFFCMGLPMLKQYFQMWWGWFSKWAFMGVVVAFWIGLGAVWEKLPDNIGNVTLPGSSSGSEMTFNLAHYIFAFVSIYLALTTPFKMGGAIMAGWSKAGKWAGSTGWRGYGSAMKYGKEWNKIKNPQGFWQKTGKFIGGGLVKMPNVYGVKEAWKERVERGEKDRMNTFKDSPYYEKIAGYQAAARFKRIDNAEGAKSIYDINRVIERLKDKKDDAGRGFDILQEYLNTLRAERKSEEEINDVIQNFVSGSPGTYAKISEKAGMTPNEASWASLLMGQYQYLLSRRARAVGGKQLIDNIKRGETVLPPLPRRPAVPPSPHGTTEEGEETAHAAMTGMVERGVQQALERAGVGAGMAANRTQVFEAATLVANNLQIGNTAGLLPGSMQQLSVRQNDLLEKIRRASINDSKKRTLQDKVQRGVWTNGFQDIEEVLGNEMPAEGTPEHQELRTTAENYFQDNNRTNIIATLTANEKHKGDIEELTRMLDEIKNRPGITPDAIRSQITRALGNKSISDQQLVNSLSSKDAKIRDELTSHFANQIKATEMAKIRAAASSASAEASAGRSASAPPSAPPTVSLPPAPPPPPTP